jgi:hypothetical protein
VPAWIAAVAGPADRKEQRGMPRPTKLTRQVHDQIILAVRAGSYLSVAAAAAGIGTSTLHRWIADPRPLYRAFRDDVRRAEAEAEVRAVGMIVQAAARAPSTTLKMLERRHPERWGRARESAGSSPAGELPDESAEDTPRSPGPETRVFVYSREWRYLLNQLCMAALLGRTPREYFDGLERLEQLRISSVSRPWWEPADYYPDHDPTALLPDGLGTIPAPGDAAG